MSPIVKILNDLIYNGFEYFGKYYSKYRAFVVSNEDPLHYNRIKVEVPGIMGLNELWVYGTNQFSGKGYGAQILPQVGEVVWIEFEQGNPNKPIWSHGHFGEGDIPKELQNPKIFWFKTPKGLLAEMDDDKDEIRLTDLFNNKVVMNEAGISLVLGDGKKIFLGDLDKTDQPTVLGDNLETIVAAHNKGILGAFKSIANVSKGLTNFATKMAAATTPAGLVIALATEVPSLVKDLKENTTTSDESNKSINDITNTIPKIKSSKVFIKK